MTKTQKLTQINIINSKFQLLSPALNERSRRLWASTEASVLDYGGVSIVVKATGITAVTIRAGLAELNNPNNAAPVGAIRRLGGGRKKIVDLHPEIKKEVDKIIHKSGDPMKHITWTHLSIDKITAELRRRGYAITKTPINRLLWKEKFSLRKNQKELHKKSDPDRDAQFNYIDEQAGKYLQSGDMVTSIDAKKTEKIGNFKNDGATYSKQGEATLVDDHDFGHKHTEGTQKGQIIKAIPFGVYDIKLDKGYVNVGTDHNTSELAVESIRRWYNKEGKINYPKAKNLMITADSGGANGSKVWQWKWSLQLLANETGLAIHVYHYPAGTSKWNKIEHKVFSFISQNWQGVPLRSYEIVLGFIEGTKTETGLSITAELDKGTYELKKKPTEEQMKSMNFKPHDFRPDWNYSIYPQS